MKLINITKRKDMADAADEQSVLVESDACR